MPVRHIRYFLAVSKLTSGLELGLGRLTLQLQAVLLPYLQSPSMHHLAQDLRLSQNIRDVQCRAIHAQQPLLASAHLQQHTKHGRPGQHVADPAVHRHTFAAGQVATQLVSPSYRRWRSSTTSRSPQADSAAAAAADTVGSSKAYSPAALETAQQLLQEWQEQQQQQQQESAAAAASAGVTSSTFSATAGQLQMQALQDIVQARQAPFNMLPGSSGAAVTAASRNRTTSSSMGPVRRRRVSSALAAAAAAAAAECDASAMHAVAGPATVSPRGMGVVAAAAATNSSGRRSRSTSSSIEPVRRRRISSSLAASMAAAANSSSSSRRTASSAALDAVTAAATAQAPAGLQQQHQQQFRPQQQQGPRGPRRSSTSSLWPVQQQWLQQQQWQQQQQQQSAYQQQQEVRRLQELCRHPDLHWQHVQQQQQHVAVDLHGEDEQQEQQLTWQQQQQQLVLQWPPELVVPPPACEPVLLDISALWRENQQEISAAQQPDRKQQQQQQQQQHMLQQHQQVMWVAVHQPGGPGSPAAVWVSGVQLELQPEQLQLLGHSAELQQALVRLQRPDMGQAPAAVVEGLTFLHSSSVQRQQQQQQNLQTAGLAAVAGAGDAADTVAATAHSTEDSTSELDSSSSSSGWLDYLLLSSGDFSVVEHANMFPNSLVHCGQRRILHNARNAADVAAFVAEATEPALRQHMINLIRQAWDRRNYEDAAGGDSSSSGSGSSSLHHVCSSRRRGNRGLDPHWVMKKILQRWGVGAMVKFGVDDAYFSARFAEAGVMVLPPPSPDAATAVPDISAYSAYAPLYAHSSADVTEGLQ